MKRLNSNRIRLVVIGIAAMIVIGSGIVKADLVMDTAPADDIPGSGKGESFSHDGLRLYLAVNSDILPDGYGSRDICVVERQSIDAPWGEPVNLGPNINTDDHEGWPVISADELELYFGRGPDNGTQRWMRSTRASKDDPWGPATEYTGIFPSDFSSDGLEKYSYWSGWRSGYGGSDIWVMTRETIDDEWGNPVNLGPIVNNSDNQARPSISGDGLALFFVQNSRLHMSVRVTDDGPWGPAVDVGSPVNGYSWLVFPEVSPDGSTLYCNRGGGLGFTQVSIKPFVDFTYDDIVDIDDLSAMIEYWGTDNSFYDIAPAAWGDGVVDDADLEVLMSYYGQVVDYTRVDVIDVKLPHNPQPGDGWRTDVENALPISWTPGDTVTVHDLFLGTDREAVENANISDTSGVYRGEQAGNSYTPPEGVQAGQTYYWRLDEVRSQDSAKKGEIWSFTVVDYMVDNFESYTDDVNEVTFEGPTIWNTWIDAWFTGATGSIVGYSYPPFAETLIVHTGVKAMPFFYDNDGTLFEGEEDEVTGVPYYSETERTWAEPQDWAGRGVEFLTLWFYGEPDNSAEQFYVALEDSGGNRKDIIHPDPAALTVNNWQQWSIPLADFTDVDLTAIKVMYIGVGEPTSNQPGGSGLVRIDDIELHRTVTP